MVWLVGGLEKASQTTRSQSSAEAAEYFLSVWELQDMAQRDSKLQEVLQSGQGGCGSGLREQMTKDQMEMKTAPWM